MASIHKRTVRWTTKSGEQRETTKYQARYVGRSGKEHARLFVKKKDAQAWLDDQTAKMQTGQWVDPRAGRTTLAAFSKDWLAHKSVKPATLSTYRSILDNHVLPHIGGMRLDEVTSDDVADLVQRWKADGAAATTVNARYLTLAILMRAAIRGKRLVESPCVGVELPSVAASAELVPITSEVVAAMAATIEPRYQAFVMLGAGSGMRRGEMLGLTRDRVADAFGTIRVDRQLSRIASETPPFGPTKTPSSNRTIYVADVVIEAIKSHEKAFGLHSSGLIFTNLTGGVLSTSTLQAAWSKAAKAVGTDATPHDLRHYFASTQLAAGVSIKELQAQLGHKSATETLDTYGHLMADERAHSRAVMQQALSNLPDTNRTVEGLAE